MQHHASPLQSDQAFDTASSVMQGHAQTLSSTQDNNATRTRSGEPQQTLSARRHVEGPDLSGAIERVLAWHRARSPHH
ncbi:MAG: hypothetical protein V4739_04535 [Pseudomonadota bacterium]